MLWSILCAKLHGTIYNYFINNMTEMKNRELKSYFLISHSFIYFFQVNEQWWSWNVSYILWVLEVYHGRARCGPLFHSSSLLFSSKKLAEEFLCHLIWQSEKWKQWFYLTWMSDVVHDRDVHNTTFLASLF